MLRVTLGVIRLGDVRKEVEGEGRELGSKGDCAVVREETLNGT